MGWGWGWGLLGLRLLDICIRIGRPEQNRGKGAFQEGSVPDRPVLWHANLQPDIADKSSLSGFSLFAFYTSCRKHPSVFYSSQTVHLHYIPPPISTCTSRRSLRTNWDANLCEAICNIKMEDLFFPLSAVIDITGMNHLNEGVFKSEQARLRPHWGAVLFNDLLSLHNISKFLYHFSFNQING